MLNYSRRKTFARNGATEINSTIRASVDALKQQHDEERAALYAVYAATHAPIPFTSDDLAQATHIRTATGWYKVVRVNKASVTVATGYSWTDRHPIDKILEVRTIA